MKITPLDIRQKRFEQAFRGFARREVEAFLELLAGEFEEVVKENIAHKDELKRMAARLEQHQERERALQETMVTAQKVSDDLKLAAKKEAEIIVAEAELQADRIVQSAQERLTQTIRDLHELKRQRVQFEANLRSIIEGHARLLESFRAAWSLTDEPASTGDAEEPPYLQHKPGAS